jgi:hypothetical protein
MEYDELVFNFRAWTTSIWLVGCTLGSNLFGLIILVWWSYVGLGCVYIVGLGIVWSCAIKCKSIISCWVTNVMLSVLLVQVVLGRDRFIRYFIAPQDQVHIVLAYSNKWFYNNRYLCWYISDGLGRAYILFLRAVGSICAALYVGWAINLTLLFLMKLCIWAKSGLNVQIQGFI